MGKRVTYLAMSGSWGKHPPMGRSPGLTVYTRGVRCGQVKPRAALAHTCAPGLPDAQASDLHQATPPLGQCSQDPSLQSGHTACPSPWWSSRGPPVRTLFSHDSQRGPPQGLQLSSPCFPTRNKEDAEARAFSV